MIKIKHTNPGVFLVYSDDEEISQYISIVYRDVIGVSTVIPMDKYSFHVACALDFEYITVANNVRNCLEFTLRSAASYLSNGPTWSDPEWVEAKIRQGQETYGAVPLRKKGDWPV